MKGSDKTMNEKELTPKERVSIELNELNDKRSRLEVLIAKGGHKRFGDKQAILLENQLFVMNLYANILKQRLENWD